MSDSCMHYPEVIEITFRCEDRGDCCACLDRIRPIGVKPWHCYHEMRCKYGTFENPEVDPFRECGIQPLMLVTPDYVKGLLIKGPDSTPRMTPAPRYEGTRSAYVGDDGWFYVKLEYEGREWIWRLCEGRWWDGDDMPILVGRWPD